MFLAQALHDLRALSTPALPGEEGLRFNAILPVSSPGDTTIAQQILAQVAAMRKRGELNQSLCWSPEELELLAMFAINAKNQIVALSTSSSGRAELDAVYTERDSCVALLARLAAMVGFSVTWARHEGEWEDDWRHIVYIDLPTGQVSWHIHDSEWRWFAWIPTAATKWDGHTTEEKYRRVVAFAASPFSTSGRAEAALASSEPAKMAFPLLSEQIKTPLYPKRAEEGKP